jgi:type II secretory pathway pseudopilin PulG
MKRIGHSPVRRHRRQVSRSGAFTLLEILFTVTLVVAFVAGIGLSWRGGGRAAGLQAGQATVAGLVAAARGTAAATGRNAALLAQAGADPADGALRRLVVATRNRADTAWEPVDAWVELPAGVALLPPLAPEGAAVRAGEDWTGLRSRALSTATEVCDAVACHLLVFTPRGTVNALGGGPLIVAPVVALPPGSGTPWRYEQPEAVRGVIVSSYGQVTWVETREGF